MGTLIENLNQIDSIKSGIKSAIEEKGVDMTNVSFPDYPAAIGSISTAFVTETLSVSVNGTYYPSAGVDGFSEVRVDVPAPVPVTETLNVSVNGTYAPGQGVDGFSQVVVDVPQSVTGYTLSDVVMNQTSSYLYDSNVTRVPIGGLVGGYNITDNIYGNIFWVRNSVMLVSVDFPNCSVVDNFGFYKQSYLQTVCLSNCECVNNNAFEECVNLSNISLPVCSFIAPSAFKGCGLLNISLPSCLILWSSCFHNCNSLSDVYIPVCGNVGNNAFCSCTSLSQVTLNVCSFIGNSAFKDCTSLESLTIGLTSVCKLNNLNAFQNTPISTGSGSIYVPSSLVDAYKSANHWSVYSNHIFAIPE